MSIDLRKNPRNPDGVPQTEAGLRVGSEALFITQNLCDPTTWYTESVRETDKALTDSGDGLTWNSGDTGWIDIVHGKIFDEEVLATTEAHGFAVEVKVDAVVKTMRTPFADSGGDYEVDYGTGDIVFYASQAGKTVTASYSRQNGSEWVLAPADGKYLDIEVAEVQFSKDVILNDDVDFEIWVYNPEDLPNKVMYSRTTYRHFRNFIDEALGSYPVVPAMGGSKRGVAQDVYGFPFRYGTVRRMDSAVGAELRVRLRNDVAFGGEFATATFYCTSHDCPT